MQHYLKTYKKLETIGITERAPGQPIYDRVIMLSALPQKKVKPATPAITRLKENSTKSWRFNKSLQFRLGIRGTQLRVVGAGLQLTATLCHHQVYEKRQTRLQLSLEAARLYKYICYNSAPDKVDIYHYLGCLFTAPGAKPLFIRSNEFLNTAFAPHTALQLLRQTYALGVILTPNRKVLKIFKRYINLASG